MQEVREEAVDAEGETQFVYCDSFAGIFIDEQGFLNIATLTGSFQAFSSQISQFGEQVILQQFTYSYNHLVAIKNALEPLMDYDVFTIAICEVSNQTRVYTTSAESIEQAVEVLTNERLFSETAVNFIVETNGGNQTTNFVAYSGDGINGGTLGANAICNDTGQLGLLTNYHVVPVGSRAQVEPLIK